MISRISETVGENEIAKKVERGEPRPESPRFSMRIRGGTKAVKGSLKNLPKTKKMQHFVHKGSFMKMDCFYPE